MYFSGSALQCYSCVDCKEDLTDANQITCSSGENRCLKQTDSTGGKLIKNIFYHSFLFNVSQGHTVSIQFIILSCNL